MGQDLKRDYLYWNLLRVLYSEDKNLTAQEVLDAYTRKRPKPATFAGKMRRFFSLPLSVAKVERYLRRFVEDKLVDDKGVTRFIEASLRDDVKLYAISAKGRSAILGKKKS